MTINEIIENNCREIYKQRNNDKPMFIFLGGLPGSGKTLLIEKVKSKYVERDFAIIDADLYRKYLDINYKDRYKAVDDSVLFSNYIEEKILNYAIKNKKDIISVSSLRAKEIFFDIIEKKLLVNNYKINCGVIVTNEIESILSSLERYVNCIQNQDDVPRLVKIDYFKLCCDGIKKTLKSFSKSSYINEIVAYKRGNDFLPPIEFFNTKNKKLENEISNEIEFQLNSLDKNLILKRLKIAENRLNELGIGILEKKEIEKIRLYIEDKFKHMTQI